jgi:hypothetical protein
MTMLHKLRKNASGTLSRPLVIELFSRSGKPLGFFSTDCEVCKDAVKTLIPEIFPPGYRRAGVRIAHLEARHPAVVEQFRAAFYRLPEGARAGLEKSAFGVRAFLGELKRLEAEHGIPIIFTRR